MVRLATIILASVFILGACESGTVSRADNIDEERIAFTKKLDSWIGSTESELVSRQGTPDSVYTASDGTRIITFNLHRHIETDGEYWGRDGDKFSSNIVEKECNVAYTIIDHSIQSWELNGNFCPEL